EEPNKTFSQAVRTTSPAISSTHARAGVAGLAGKAAALPCAVVGLPGPKPLVVAAAAIPMASNVMTVSAPFATDFSARHNVTMPITPKNAAAGRVSHIGNVGERQT